MPDIVITDSPGVARLAARFEALCARAGAAIAVAIASALDGSAR